MKCVRWCRRRWCFKVKRVCGPFYLNFAGNKRPPTHSPDFRPHPCSYSVHSRVMNIYEIWWHSSRMLSNTEIVFFFFFQYYSTVIWLVCTRSDHDIYICENNTKTSISSLLHFRSGWILFFMISNFTELCSMSQFLTQHKLRHKKLVCRIGI